MNKFLKNIVFKFGGCFASLAVIVTVFVENSCCIFITHQDELPGEAKKLRKF